MAARVVRGLNSGSGAGFGSMRSEHDASKPAASYEGTTNARGEPHGDGKRVFSSGHVYEGKWQDGRCHGFGKFTYPDGQIFEGEWKEGRRDGQGKLMMPSGEVIAGTWVADCLSGPVRRWHASDDKASAQLVRSSAASAPAAAPASSPATAAPAAASSASSGNAAAEAADVAWLRESHDVIWQLNVELQMENERLVGENRRLRLKLRQMLQQQQQQGQAVGANGGGGAGCGCGGSGASSDSKLKVVEGRLRRKSEKKESSKKASKGDKAWLDKLMKGDSTELEAFLSGGVKKPSGGEESDAEKRRRIAEELCAKAETELTDRLLTAGWGDVKRLGNPGDAEAFARSVLKEKLSRVRHSASAFLGDGPSLQQAAREASEALDAVLDWPSRLHAMQSRSGLPDADAMLSAVDLHADGCGLSGARVGAACVLLKASRAVQTIDLGGNQMGDEGARMVCDALKGNSTLRSLRLHSNSLSAVGGTALADLLSFNRTLTRLDVRGNHFDARAEQALRAAGGDRVIIHETDERPVAPAKPAANTADAFISYSDAKRGDVPRQPAGNSADAFLDYTDRKLVGAPQTTLAEPSARDAEAFLSFSRGGGGSAIAPPPNPPPPAAQPTGGGSSSSSADAFLAFTGGGSASPAKPSLGMDGRNAGSKPKGVSFGGGGGGSAATKPSGLGGGAMSASDFLASLPD